MMSSMVMKMFVLKCIKCGAQHEQAADAKIYPCDTCKGIEWQIVSSTNAPSLRK